jgi:hypothetical protein
MQVFPLQKNLLEVSLPKLRDLAFAPPSPNARGFFIFKLLSLHNPPSFNVFFGNHQI